MPALPQMVSLRCSSVIFALPIEAVREIVMVPQITPVPDVGPFIRGVINLRGRIVPVMDLALRLGFGRGPSHPEGRILVVEHNREQLGLLADDASEVLRVAPESVSAPPELAGGGTGAVRGVIRLADRILFVLDLDRVLADPTTTLPPVSAESLVT